MNHTNINKRKMSFFNSTYGTALKACTPLLFITPVGGWYYNKRQKALTHPVLQRTLKQLQKDHRIVDYCGTDLKAGWSMEINEDPTQNYIKFKFDIKGSSGHLGTSVIADYLTHRELMILENER